MISLSDQVKLFAKEVDGIIDKVIPSVRTKVAESLINRTPVDTGEARGNWQSSIDEPITTHTDRLDKEAGFAPAEGSGASLREAEMVAKTEIGKDFYITNNADHIVPLEYGHSDQAPNGMQRLTVADFHYFVGEAIRESK